MKRRWLVFLMLAAAASVFGGGNKDSSKPGARVVTTTCRASYANEQWYKDMHAAFTTETGIEVLVQPTPGNDDYEHNNKVNVDLVAGGTIDVIESLGLRDQQGRIDAGFFMPLNDLMTQAGIDVEGTWGKYMNYQAGGVYYDVPFKQEMRCVFYNRDMFDKAGIPYPQGPWTWDEYIALAKRLTNISQGQYGSLMLNGTPWVFVQARQRKIPFYKPDGTSNFDHPVFAEGLQWYYDLSHKNKIQMNVTELLADNAQWNYWAMKDNMAMFPQSNFYTRLLNSQADYPRNWKYGITQYPSTGKDGNTTLVNVGYISINKNAAHPKEALEYVVWIARRRWKYENGLPALNVSADDVEEVFGPTAAASNGQVTAMELYKGLMGAGMDTEPHNIIGPAAAEYDNIVREETDRFNLDQQDLVVTIRRIVSRANEAIANAK